MTHTAARRFVVALHVAATFALCAITTQMLFMAFAVLGAYNDLCSSIPFVRSLPAGWQPGGDLSIPGLHELASFAAFPGAPALLVLGLYVAFLENAAASACSTRAVLPRALPALGLLWIVAAVALWFWAIQSVHETGYMLTRAGMLACPVFVASVFCLLVELFAHRNPVAPAALDQNAA